MFDDVVVRVSNHREYIRALNDPQYKCSIMISNHATEKLCFSIKASTTATSADSSAVKDYTPAYNLDEVNGRLTMKVESKKSTLELIFLLVM